MKFQESRLYTVMEYVAKFFSLNLLWLVTCLAVVTIFPATAAMFAVVRDWVRGKERGIVAPYFRYLRENFAQSFGVGLLWTGFGFFLGLDVVALRMMTHWLQTPLFVILVLVILLYAGASVYLFPIMVQYRSKWWEVITNAFLLTVTRPIVTLACWGIIVLACTLFFFIPISLLLGVAATAYGVYRLCHSAFPRIEVQQSLSDAPMTTTD